VRTPENTEEDLGDPEPAAGGDTQMQYSSDKLYSPSIGAVTKVTCRNLVQYRFLLIIPNI
jgi:hypothetical protein